MRNSLHFTESVGGQNGNFAYHVKVGYAHDGRAAMEYTYNGLRLFWNTEQTGQSMSKPYTSATKISEVINDTAFGDYGRLIFPADTGYFSGNTLGELSLTWYTGINADKTVEIANYMKNQTQAEETLFYDIYTDEEKAADPAKKRYRMKVLLVNGSPNKVLQAPAP